MAVNWGLAGGNGFQNALATGMQMGAQAREAREKKEYNNALAQYDPNNAETLKPIMQANPEVGLKLRGEVEARQKEQQTADLTQRALSGDAEALQQLATTNFDRWKSLDGQQRESIKQENEILGNVAMDILSAPPQQRMAKVQAHAQQLGNQFPEVLQIAQLPPQQIEQALRAQVAESGMVKQMIEMERPKYMAVPEGGTLVDTRNPGAVQTFGQGQPVSKTLSNGVTAYQNPDTGEWFDNPQEAMGGSGGNAGGGFPGY